MILTTKELPYKATLDKVLPCTCKEITWELKDQCILTVTLKPQLSLMVTKLEADSPVDRGKPTTV